MTEVAGSDIFTNTREKGVIDLYKQLNLKMLSADSPQDTPGQAEPLTKIFKAADGLDADMMVFLTGYILQELHMSPTQQEDQKPLTTLRGLEDYLTNLGPAIKGVRMQITGDTDIAVKNIYNEKIRQIFNSINSSITALTHEKKFDIRRFPTINNFIGDAAKAYNQNTGFGLVTINPYYAESVRKQYTFTDEQIPHILKTRASVHAKLTELMPLYNQRMDPRERIAKSLEHLGDLPTHDPFNFKIQQFPDAMTDSKGNSLHLKYVLDHNIRLNDIKSQQDLDSMEEYGTDVLRYVAALPKGDFFSRMIVNNMFLPNQKMVLMRNDTATLVKEYSQETNALASWQLWMVSRMFQPFVDNNNYSGKKFDDLLDTALSNFDDFNFGTFKMAVESYILDPASPFAQHPLIAPIRKAITEQGEEISRSLEGKWFHLLPKSKEIRELIANIRAKQKAKVAIETIQTNTEEAEIVLEKKVQATESKIIEPKEHYFNKGTPENYKPPVYLVNDSNSVAEEVLAMEGKEPNGTRRETLFAKGRVFEGMTRVAMQTLVLPHELVIPEVFINLQNGVENCTQFSVRADAVVLDPKRNNTVVAVLESKFGNAEVNIQKTVGIHQQALKTSFPEAEYGLVHFDNKGIKNLNLDPKQIIDFQSKLLPEIRKHAPDIAGNLELIGATMLELGNQNTDEATAMLQAVSMRLNQILDETNNYVMSHINDSEDDLKREKTLRLSTRLQELTDQIEKGNGEVIAAVQSSEVEQLLPTAGHVITPDGCWRTEISIKKRNEYHNRIRANSSDEIKTRVKKLEEAKGLEIKHPEIFAGLNIESKLPLILVLRNAFYGKSPFVDLDTVWKKYNDTVEIPYKNPQKTVLSYLDKLQGLGLIVRDGNKVSLNPQNYRNTVSAAGYMYEFLKSYSEVLSANGWTLTDLLGYGDSQGIVVRTESDVTQARLAQETRCKVLYELSSCKTPIQINDLAKKIGIDSTYVAAHLNNLSLAGKRKSSANGIVTIQNGIITQIQHPELLEDFVITMLYADSGNSPSIIEEGSKHLQAIGKDQAKTMSQLIQNSYNNSPYTLPAK